MIGQMFRGLALAAAIALAGPAAASGPEGANALAVPTAADFGKLPFLTDPAIAPDGNRIAAKGLRKGEEVIVLIDVATDATRLSTIAMPKDHSVEWVRWAGSGKLLASLSRPGNLLSLGVRVTRVISIDLTSGKQMAVGPRDQGIYGDNVIHVDEGGKFLLLNTQRSLFDYPSVYRVDLDTGKSKQVVSPRTDVWDWYADRSGVVRAGIGASGKQWWLLYRTGESEEFQRARHRVDEKEKSDVQSFSAVIGSDAGYAIAKSPGGRFAVYRYDFKADAIGALVYENPTVDVDDFDIGPDGEVASVSYTDEHDEIAWFDPKLRKLQATIDKALPGRVNRVLSMSQDKKRVLILSSSATDPGTYYLLDRTSSKMGVLAHAFDAIAGKQLADMKPVRYKARDGLEIRGYLTLPHGRDPKGLPLIVMPHGGPFARDSQSYDPWVQFLATRGYAVLQPNFRGSTGFGVEFVEKGEGQWGRGMQDDAVDGVKWLAGEGTIDPKRVCIMGASYGGYAAMWATVRDQDVYRCAISFAGISDVAAQLNYDRKSFSASRYFRDWRARIQGDGKSLDELSPLKFVDRITMPLLIAHGSADTNVPASQSQRLHEALLKLGRRHEFVIYEGEGHGFADPLNSTNFLDRVGKFLAEHNPT